MTIVVVSIGVMALGVAFWMLARATVPAQTVAEILYDTEQSGSRATTK